MEAIVKAVLPDTPAQEAGLAEGDRITAINGHSDLEDMFDYQQLVLLEDALTLTVQKAADGQTATVCLDLAEADTPDEAGLVFASPLFGPIKTCNNACPFCFIDQQPDGLRPSLYVKDDDYRLSYFCNTYITLTNLTRHDRTRIEKLRPGPLYVSVHATNPEIRAQLLKNPKAPPIMAMLGWLADLEVPFHAQIVVTPGINDTAVLSQSLEDLYTLWPHCLSVAIVPVGLTQHRQALPGLTAVDGACAEAVLDRLAAFAGTDPNKAQFAFCSDEFYLLANRPFPGYDAYGGFPQLDDGVGTGRHLVKAFFDLEHTLPLKITPARNHLIVTGKLGAMALTPIVTRLNQIEGLYIDLTPVESRFWGQAITVSGLVTGQDILHSLDHTDLSGYESILIPETMCKDGEAVFLDGKTVDEVSNTLGCPITVVVNPNDAQSLLNVLLF